MVYVILHPSGGNRNCVIQQASEGGVEERAGVETGGGASRLNGAIHPHPRSGTLRITVFVNQTVSV
jgi:hypothetical protein